MTVFDCRLNLIKPLPYWLHRPYMIYKHLMQDVVAAVAAINRTPLRSIFMLLCS